MHKAKTCGLSKSLTDMIENKGCKNSVQFELILTGNGNPEFHMPVCSDHAKSLTRHWSNKDKKEKIIPIV